jgi:nicotinamidase-related amidase
MEADRYTKPHYDTSALIVIDTQVDFLDGGTLEIPGTTAALPNMARLLKLFRRLGRPIVHIVRLYRPDGGNVDVCRRALVEQGFRAAAPGSPGSQIAPELLPGPGVELDPDLLMAGGIQQIGAGEVAIYKPRWGAFYRTPLDEHLRNLAVDTLVFCGCNYPNCPRTSIYEAGERDYRLVLARDALSGLYERGEREMAGICVNLAAADEVIRAMEGHAKAVPTPV